MQVHRARLRDSGTEVAVKVQYPEVQVSVTNSVRHACGCSSAASLQV